MDDGRCHICRRWPSREDSAYGVTACVSCEETEAVMGKFNVTSGEVIFWAAMFVVMVFVFLTA